jgi:glycosyltransferase involved in cell wall biosynthesis
MRILHIISTLNPAAGGPSEGVRLLLSYKKEGYVGEVITFDAPDAPYLKNLPFKVHAIGPVHTTYGFTWKLYPWLRKNRGQFDGFIVNGLWQYCGLASMLALHGRAPYMVFTHGMLDPYFKRAFPLKHIKKALYWYPFEFWVLRNAYRVLFTTETERQLAQQSFSFWSWKPQVVPYGIRASASPEKRDIEEFHQRIPALRGKRFLLFLGRIHPKKGCDLLIQAFCDVAASDPELHLLMAGPDHNGWIKELQAIAEKRGVADRIHWPGVLRDGPKWGAFRAAEAFVLPSHQENFGIAVAEALACGLPVLLSDQVNIVSLIQEHGCCMVASDTLQGTRELLQRWIALGPEDRETMRANANACFQSRFDMRENAYTIISLFETALNNKYDRRRLER